MNAPALTQYHARLQRVLRYIDAHLDGDLSLERLSGIAAFSKHHFHRQFSHALGIGVYQYVRLARLRQASHRLAYRDGESVLQIALDSGYQAPESFARAFRQQTGQSPSEFRAQPQWLSWHETYQPFSAGRSQHMTKPWQDDQIRILETQDLRVGVLEHRGDPRLIGDSIRRFIAWRKSMGLPPKISATFNLLYDHPDRVAPDDFRLDLCAATDREITPNDAGVIAKIIPGGRCAVLRAVGPEEILVSALGFLYGDWLPRSGEEMRDFPLYCQRVSFHPEVEEHEAVTDVFLPLK